MTEQLPRVWRHTAGHTHQHGEAVDAHRPQLWQFKPRSPPSCAASELLNLGSDRAKKRSRAHYSHRRAASSRTAFARGALPLPSCVCLASTHRDPSAGVACRAGPNARRALRAGPGVGYLQRGPPAGAQVHLAQWRGCRGARASPRTNAPDTGRRRLLARPLAPAPDGAAAPAGAHAHRVAPRSSQAIVVPGKSAKSTIEEEKQKGKAQVEAWGKVSWGMRIAMLDATSVMAAARSASLGEVLA